MCELVNDHLFHKMRIAELVTSSFPPSVALSTTITRAPELHARQSAPNAESLSCDSYTSLNVACAASTPGFLTLGPGQQYSCLCFNQSAWAPSVFEGYLQGCLSYLRTASTAYYSSIGGDDLPTDYCTAVSNLVATAVSTSSSMSASTTLTAPLASYSAACKSWSNLVESCATQTSSSTGLQPSFPASCLCGGSSSSYSYDNVWQSCLSYQQVANSTEWSVLGGTYALTTPCAAAAGQLGSATALLTDSVTTTKDSPTSSRASASAAMSSTVTSSSSSSDLAVATGSIGARHTAELLGLYSMFMGILVSIAGEFF